ncbi:hypothetical protein KDM41_12115 [bacterium]|nr:hypothetical protein [bacterium]
MAKSHFTFEKRRKELEKQKKKEAKRAERAERKAAGEGGAGAPIVEVDEWGNAVEIEGDDEQGDGRDDETDHPQDI